MKNNYLLIVVILSNFIFGQNKQFLYEYKFISDSTNKTDIKTEIMILNIQKDRSEYYSSVRYASDSAQAADYKRGINSMPPGNPLVSEWVTKYPNSNQLIHTTFMMSDKYKVKQDVEFNWKLTNEFSKILNYDVQKATTEFGGRKWTAWFTKDIPIQDGPYKFRGLPGLILKIEDQTKNHTWELKGIRSSQEEFVYPDLKNYRIIELNHNQFIKKFKNYRQNPTADLVGQIPDQHDSTGKFRTSAEIIKELNQMALEKLAKDNNLIEIDLLK
ncbi:GLPGLI family protein [Epilithonimonas sp.]|uniref:GLPGLI family protein n=1 Tax=Epilithonimonas sp. TaxID=2894511 RepID=UPI00289E8362|nr:GLPGLI family protein [Epilithonimonas sp.]